MAVIDREWQIAFRGVVMGRNTTLALSTLEGFGTPEVRSEDAPLMDAHGELAGVDLYSGRKISFTIQAAGATTTDVANNLDLVKQVFALADNTDEIFRARLYGWSAPRQLLVRPRRCTAAVAFASMYGVIPIPVELFAPDPRFYSDTLHSLVGPGTAANAGNFLAHPTFHVAGPVASGYTLTIGTKTLTINRAIGAGEYVDINTYTREVVDQAGLPRTSAIGTASDWPTLAPGNNTVSFTGIGSGTVTMSWRDAWI